MTTHLVEDVRIASPSHSLGKTIIQNRRLTYLNRTDYVSSPLTQERLFPLLYEKLILRHKSRSERLDEETSSKSRTLTNVLLDASDHMEKIQRQRDRTDEARVRDEAMHEEEQATAETIPKNVLMDRELSRMFLEKMIQEKFLAGGDEEFDYSSVDEDDIWDDWETLEEDLRSTYFDDETPENAEGERVLTGETGVQDF